ncbi:MAG TPA: hydroxysqualene dehydroxylase HpnE [Burkholderiales bacterium]
MGSGVAVVGAGYAGMAAAVTLAERGVPVTVFEAGQVPGGRARRIVSQGNELDNGQHILVGAYSELFRLMRTVGVPSEALLRIPLEIRYTKEFFFRRFWLPAPLGGLMGLLAARGIPPREKLAAVRFMLHMRKARFRLQPDISVQQLLEQHGQSGRIGHFLWRPLCVSALNTPAEQASANAFLAALRDTLMGDDDASDLLLPCVDLSKLFPEPAMDFLVRSGNQVHLRHPVQGVHELKNEFSAVIVAVGPHQLKNLLPELAPEYSYQPINTCYLQYSKSVKLPFPMLGLAGGLVQWVFDRGALTGEKGLLAAVISAQGDHQQMAQDELAEACHRELAAEKLVGEKPLWARVIAEKRATISCTPGVKRPDTATRFPGIFLAGDYTDPEYPPTLEAAVRSGIRAATMASKGQ